MFLSLIKKQHLIVFSRYPESGKTKTRMIPALGADGAANLQRQMTEFTISKVRKLQSQMDVSLEVRFAGGNSQKMKDWLGKDLIYQFQGEGDLGERMSRSLNQVFLNSSLPQETQKSIEKAAIIGTDCPDITIQILQMSFDYLDIYDCVIGPAADGGYYLIGISKEVSPIISKLFEGIDWGTSKVRQQTLEIVRNLNLSVAILPLLNDVDRPEDLPIWERCQLGN